MYTTKEKLREEGGWDGRKLWLSGEEFWEAHPKENWYQADHDYWKEKEPNDDSMLGGFEYLNEEDTKTNMKFLKELFGCQRLTNGISLDAGAGIGRVTKHTLSCFFGRCDLVEYLEHFVEQAETELGVFEYFGTAYCDSLVNFEFDKQYDCIWHTWVLDHLRDDDLIDYLMRAADALTERGFIVCKENVYNEGMFYADIRDSTFIRNWEYWNNILDQAGLTIHKLSYEKQFPKDFYPIHIFALRKIREEHERVPRVFTAGQTVIIEGMNQQGILQRYIKKTNRWRVQCSDGTTVKVTAAELTFPTEDSGNM